MPTPNNYNSDMKYPSTKLRKTEIFIFDEYENRKINIFMSSYDNHNVTTLQYCSDIVKVNTVSVTKYCISRNNIISKNYVIYVNYVIS